MVNLYDKSKKETDKCFEETLLKMEYDSITDSIIHYWKNVTYLHIFMIDC